ncbi:MAG: M67 family metallopeptidase [Thermomicrobiales bacterium]
MAEFSLITQPHRMIAPDVLILSPAIREAILLHLLGAAPHEGVGLLSTSSSSDHSVVTALRFYPGANLAASPTRFAMDPRDVLHAVREIRSAGQDLGGIVHSHVYGPPTPSEIDLAEAYYPDSLMIIVSFARQPAEIRAWHLSKTDEQTTVTNVRITTTAA